MSKNKKGPSLKKIILPLLILFAGILGTVAAIALGSGEKTLRLSGTLEGDHFGVISEVGGKIISLSADEGDTISAGEVIAEIDGEMQKLMVGQQEASLKAKRAKLRELKAGAREEELEQAEARVENAFVDAAYWEDQTARLKKLYQDHNIPETNYKDALHQFHLAGGRLEEARAALELLRKGPRTETIEAMEAEIAAGEKAIAQGNLSLRKHKITTPVGGSITMLSIKKGDMVSPGQKVGKITQEDRLHFRIYLPSNYLYRVRAGREITAYPYGQEEKKCIARIKTVANEAEFTPKNTETPEAKEDRVFKVTLEFSKKETASNELKPGMTMIAEIPPMKDEVK